MSIRDKIKHKNSADTPSELIKVPLWVSKGSTTTQSLYHAALKEFTIISNAIRLGQASNPKERKIILTKVAIRASVDKSNIHPRRQFELYQWIKDKNLELRNLFEQHCPPRTSYKSPSKQDIKRELSHLKSVHKKQTEDERKAIVEAFFNSNVLDDRSKLQRENSRLRQQNSDLIDKVTRLQTNIYESDQLIARLLSLLSPTQKADLKKLRSIIKEQPTK